MFSYKSDTTLFKHTFLTRNTKNGSLIPKLEFLCGGQTMEVLESLSDANSSTLQLTTSS
jgi:hypothetical protein